MKTKFVEVKKDKTINELLDELHLSPLCFLIGVNGQILNPAEKGRKKLRKGDKVNLLPIFDEG